MALKPPKHSNEVCYLFADGGWIKIQIRFNADPRKEHRHQIAYCRGVQFRIFGPHVNHQEFADPLPAFGDDIASLAWHTLQLAHGTDGKTAALSARSTWPFFKKSLYIAPTERLGGEEVGADDHVIVHGRFSNTGLPKNWIAADIVRIADGVLTEHWDVLQDEVTVTESQSGLPIFGEKFPK